MFQFVGNQIEITVEESLSTGASMEITYGLTTDPNNVSISQFKDGGEDGNDLWLVIDDEGSAIWELQDAFAN